MPIPIECDYCGERFRVREDLAGEELPCKSCGEYFWVPTRSRKRPSRPSRGKRPSRASKGPSKGPNVPLIAGVIGAMILGCGAMIWLIASHSSASSGGLFPVASVPVPKFPELPTPRRHPSGAKISFVDLKWSAGGDSIPGSRMAMRVYLPAGDHAPGSLGCVLVAPAGDDPAPRQCHGRR